MLIVKSYFEYYDGVAKLGVDKTCVYKRTKKILPGKLKRGPESHNSWPYSEDFVKQSGNTQISYDFSKYVIGFCGKLYPVVVATKTKKTGDKTASIRISLYSTQKVLDFIKSEKIDLGKTYSYRSYWSMKDFSVKTKAALDNFFSGLPFKVLEEEFQKNKCPVFIYGRFPREDNKRFHDEFLILNPRLTDYQFAKVKDPVTAWQEIYQFISGVLGTDSKPMVKLSDKELAAKAGHDSKFSFRKPPGTKRGKKQWR